MLYVVYHILGYRSHSRNRWRRHVFVVYHIERAGIGMKLFLGLDMETTGIDTKTCDILEVGAVLYDFDSHQPVVIINELITGTVTPEITELTGIRQEHLGLAGKDLKEVLTSLSPWYQTCQGVIAHNGLMFDQPVLYRHAQALGVHLPERPWIDSMIDFPYPPSTTSFRLSHIAADHGILNTNSHRAFSDVLTMLAITEKYDIDKAFELAQSPIVIVKAHVVYDNRELASKRRFRWNSSAKVWEKNMRRQAWEEQKNGWEFTSSIIG